MFTGLVEEVGKITILDRGPVHTQLVVQAPKLTQNLQLGDSLAVNGCCLTLIKKTLSEITFDLLTETLLRTSFTQLKSGDAVNLETAVKPTTAMGGHFVSGHVDTTATILALDKFPTEWRLEIAIPATYERFAASQGCIAVDGISLTIAESSPQKIRISLIPHTWHYTALSHKKVGSLVNLEFDLLAKYVEKILSTHPLCSQP